MTCFQAKDGFVYGCSGGVVHRNESYMDMETGHIIQQMDRHSAIDMDSGKLLMLPPDMPYRDDDSNEEE